MTTEQSSRLAEIAERNAKATPGAWEIDSIDGEDSNGRYKAYAVFADGKSVADTINSDVIEIHTEYDEDGDHCWDEPGRRNMEFIAHAKADIPYLLTELTAERERSLKLVELLREAERVIHGDSIDGDPGNWWCDQCREVSVSKKWPRLEEFVHKPDCLVTKLRTAADDLTQQEDHTP